MRTLVIDIGSSSLRVGIVATDGTVTSVRQLPLSVRYPNAGEVELDGEEIARLSLHLCQEVISEVGMVDCVGITCQRASTIIFDRLSGRPVGPVLSWQDLRTVLDCLGLQNEGLFLAPNQSATKAKWLVQASGRPASELAFATLETWLTWQLSTGQDFVTDRSNASVSGLINLDAKSWSEQDLSTLGLGELQMPEIVPTFGMLATAHALPGTPPITALIGDQPASLFGQGGAISGTKITFGTGAMLDMVDGTNGPEHLRRFASGCFPTVLRSGGEEITWGFEGAVLSAGSCVEWLITGMGICHDITEVEPLATSVASTEGVYFIPAFNGLGTPNWDFGARGAFLGLSHGTTRAHMARAVLEGVAHRGADLLDAARVQSGQKIEEIRVDGGMSANSYFTQFLADITSTRVCVSDEREATLRGAGLMALVGLGALTVEEVGTMKNFARIHEPQVGEDLASLVRFEWATMVSRSEKTIPGLSEISF